MSWFSRRRSRQTPPISLILLLVGFILVAFVFIGFRQLRGAQERRLRLLAGFGERVESTAENLADRFVRIVKVPEAEAAEEDLGRQAAGQRDLAQVDRYLKHVPHISLIDLSTECNEGGEGSVALRVIDRDIRLHYCPPQPEQEGAEEEVQEQGEVSPRSYLARIDLESLIEPMIVPGAFDSILLADHRGRTLFQQGEPEIRMLDLAPLAESAAERERAEADLAWVKDALGRQGTEVGPEALDQLFTLHENRPLELGSRTAMVEVEIAGSDYFVFLQPVSPRLEPPPGHGAGRPARWIAAGIISSENLLSAGLTTSPFLLFLLVSILPLGIITWPFLKLWLITRRQPFRRLDLAALLFAAIVGIALATLLVFDLLFLVRLHDDVDDQLSDLADAIGSRFRVEVLDARDQLMQLRERNDLLPEMPQDLPDDEPFDCSGEIDPDGIQDAAEEASSADLGDLTPVRYIQNPRNRTGDRAATRFIEEEVRPWIQLSDGTTHGAGPEPLDVSAYPYFDSMFWVNHEGEHGCSNLPLRRHSVLPQAIGDRAYFVCARDCQPPPLPIPIPEGRIAADIERWSSEGAGPDCADHVLPPADDDTDLICLQSLLDRTTGKSVAAIALPGLSTRFPVAALVTRLTSLAHPVLPPGYGFAIVEAGGRVLFHSESRRDLTESFLKASDEDPLLRSMLESRRRGELSLHYWGQPTRIHAQPLPGTPWSLITFRNTYDLRVRNFELIYDFLNPFLLYLAVLILLLLAAWLLLPRRSRRYLWPSSAHLEIYRSLAMSAPLVVLGFAWVLSTNEPAWIFAASVLPLPALLLLASVLYWLIAGLRAVPPKRTRRLLGRLRSPALARRAWGEKWRLLPLGGLALLVTLAWIRLVRHGAPMMPVLLGVLAASLVGAVIWYWHSFSGERRMIAFVLACGCSFSTVALLPALGFFDLARSRQIQLYTQDAQMALAQRLEEREEEIAQREGPLDEIYGAYRGKLEASKKAYLRAFFQAREAELEDRGDPPWPYGLSREGPKEREDGPETEGPQAGVEEDGPADGFVARILSARPFPVNDLSARPVESDLSRFEAVEGKWSLSSSDELSLRRERLHGIGGPIHLATTIPSVRSLPGGGLSIETGLLLLGLLVLAASPFLLSRFLAQKILLISLVGPPRAGRSGAVSSSPLSVILDEVLRTDEIVRQVVLVSTLPGESAWEGRVEDSKESQEPSSMQRLFHEVSFAEAWHGAERDAKSAEAQPDQEDEDEGDFPLPEDGTIQALEPGSEESSPGDRAELFYQRLRPASEPDTEWNTAQPVLLSRFEPSLDDPQSAAHQVAALRKLSTEDRRSVVIVAQTVPDLGPTRQGERFDASVRARATWTRLLATFSVEYGHDARTHDLPAKTSEITGKIEPLLDDPGTSASRREELATLKRNAQLIEQECSPTPVLRNIGWALLQDIEDILPLVRILPDSPVPRDPTEERRGDSGIKTALEEIKKTQEPALTGEAKEEQARRRAEAAKRLSDALTEAARRGQGPKLLLQLVVRDLAHDEDSETKLLDDAERALQARRSDASGGGGGREDTRPEASKGFTGRLGEAARNLLGVGDADQRAEQDATVGEAIAELSRAIDLVRIARRELLRRRRARDLLQVLTREHVLAKVGSEARLHYRYLWSRCTTDEKLVLLQLSENGLVNPKYFGWVMDLMNRGLVVRDPELRVMNESFQRFILQEVQRSQILEWQEEEGPSGWSVLKWILPAPLILVAGFLFVTQRDALSNVTGVLVAAISLAPLLVNLYSQFREVSARQEAKEQGKDESSEKSSK